MGTEFIIYDYDLVKSINIKAPKFLFGPYMGLKLPFRKKCYLFSLMTSLESYSALKMVGALILIQKIFWSQK